MCARLPEAHLDGELPETQLPPGGRGVDMAGQAVRDHRMLV